MNQKGFIKDVVIIVLAILLLGGGYFYFSKKPAYAPSGNSNTNQKVADETADWKTYKNTKLNYEFELPINWGDIAVIDGSFRSDISQDGGGYFVIGDKPHNGLVVLSDYNDPEKPGRYSIDWYINFYVDHVGLKYTKNDIKIAEVDGVELYIPEAKADSASANRYTYLFRKDDTLFEIGFFNKSSVTDRILSTFKFTK